MEVIKAFICQPVDRLLLSSSEVDDSRRRTPTTSSLRITGQLTLRPERPSTEMYGFVAQRRLKVPSWRMSAGGVNSSRTFARKLTETQDTPAQTLSAELLPQLVSRLWIRGAKPDSADSRVADREKV